MSWMIIYLVLALPLKSSDLPESMDGPSTFCSVLLRMGFTYALHVTTQAVVSYTALPTLPNYLGGIFLLHFPESRLYRTLSGILPFEARTFLTCILSIIQPRSPIQLAELIISWFFIFINILI